MVQSGRMSDEQIEGIVGNLLRIGVLMAAILVLAGGIFYLIRYGPTPPDYRLFRGEPKELRSLPGILMDALALDSRGMIQLGLLLLIATPVARVIFSVVAFALQRDLTYVIVTSIVLALLLYCLSGGSL